MNKSSFHSFPVAFALCFLLFVGPVACRSLYQGTVTLTAIVDSASKDYATAVNAGLVPPDIQARASATHLEYRKAAGIAHDAFVAAKLGQAADTKGALDAARMAAQKFVAVLASVLSKQRVNDFQAQIQKASKP